MGLFGKKKAKTFSVSKLSKDEIRGVELALDLARASGPDKKTLKVLNTAQSDFKERMVTDEDISFICSSLAVAINGNYAIVTEEKKAAMRLAMDDLMDLADGNGGSGDAGDMALDALRD